MLYRFTSHRLRFAVIERYKYETRPDTKPPRKNPLWRGGPSGPKSLCNACGIRNMKKRRTMIRGNISKDKKTNHTMNLRLGESLKQRLIELGREVMMQRSTTENQRQKKLGEEEQAALLLMALSYASSVHA